MRGGDDIGGVTAECEVDALNFFQPEPAPTADTRPAEPGDDDLTLGVDPPVLILPVGPDEASAESPMWLSLQRTYQTVVRHCRPYLTDPLGRIIAVVLAGGVLAGVVGAKPRAIPSPPHGAATSGLPIEPARPARAEETLVAAHVPMAAAPLVERASIATTVRRPPRPRVAAPTAATGYRGALEVDSQPAGATVFVNGQPAGRTPLVLSSLPVGSRAIRIELSGYRPWSQSVRVVADRSARVLARLDAVP